MDYENAFNSILQPSPEGEESMEEMESGVSFALVSPAPTGAKIGIFNSQPTVMLGGASMFDVSPLGHSERFDMLASTELYATITTTQEEYQPPAPKDTSPDFSSPRSDTDVDIEDDGDDDNDDSQSRFSSHSSKRIQTPFTPYNPFTPFNFSDPPQPPTDMETSNANDSDDFDERPVSTRAQKRPRPESAPQFSAIATSCRSTSAPVATSSQNDDSIPELSQTVIEKIVTQYLTKDMLHVLFKGEKFGTARDVLSAAMKLRTFTQPDHIVIFRILIHARPPLHNKISAKTWYDLQLVMTCPTPAKLDAIMARILVIIEENAPTEEERKLLMSLMGESVTGNLMAYLGALMDHRFKHRLETNMLCTTYEVAHRLGVVSRFLGTFEEKLRLFMDIKPKGDVPMPPLAARDLLPRFAF
jgi:hypothetical protein